VRIPGVIARRLGWNGCSLLQIGIRKRNAGARRLGRFLLFFCLTIPPIAAASPNPHSASPSPSPGATWNEQVLRVQIFLDASNFKPGAIDGRWGEFTRKALLRYDKTHGRAPQNYGDNPPAQFNLPFDSSRPSVITYRILPNDADLIGPAPESVAARAKLDRLNYGSFLELVAEKFHARRDLLRTLNPGYDWNRAQPGDAVKVPNVAEPFEVADAIKQKQNSEDAEKNGSVRTESDKPKEEQFQIRISVADKILELEQSGKLVGSYPITPGSDSLPAPKGEWFVKGIVWMPTFRWDEAMLQHGERSSHAYELPPGPNSPVGIVWMDLNHKGSGIHGTEAPETIGYTTSHGCIRLSNWNALDLGRKVLPGVHVRIR
jgi:lipoprotein-anchoring transpeptidase ErfK/SrfK